jgi:hypothetical protein
MGLLHVLLRYQTLYPHMQRISLSQPSTRPRLIRHPIRQPEAIIEQLCIWLLSRLKTQMTCYHLIPTYPESYNTKSIKSTFILDSKTLRQYVVEDFLFAFIGKQLLLLVATSHLTFTLHWFRIYEVQAKGCKLLIFGDVLVFRLKLSS